MFRSVIVAAAAILLAGCQTAAERTASDQRKCAGYGFTPGTDNYANCMMRLDLDRARARDAAYEESQAALRDASNFLNKRP